MLVCVPPAGGSWLGSSVYFFQVSKILRAAININPQQVFQKKNKIRGISLILHQIYNNYEEISFDVGIFDVSSLGLRAKKRQRFIDQCADDSNEFFISSAG
jgi:hypothetical protein